MVDNGAGDLPIFESGAIMWYLGTQHDPQGMIFPKVSIRYMRHTLATWWDLLHSYPDTSTPIWPDGLGLSFKTLQPRNLPKSWRALPTMMVENLCDA